MAAVIDADLRKAEDEGWHELHALVDSLPPDAIERPGYFEEGWLAKDMLARQKGGSGPFAGEMRRLAAEAPEQINYKEISRAFGTPKPTLANSYQPELLSLRTFPTLMGYSSRIMAESWESNTFTGRFWRTKCTCRRRSSMY